MEFFLGLFFGVAIGGLGVYKRIGGRYIGGTPQ